MFDSGSIVENLEITDIAFGGDGVARTEDGAVFFIPFTAIGDIVTVQVTTAHSNFYRADVVKYTKQSEQRERPKCSLYGRCGGCVYQHLTYEAEIEAKRRQFTTVMSRIGHFSDFPELECFVPSQERYGYRNKLRLEPILNKNSHVFSGYGFCLRDNRTFMPVKECCLAKPQLNGIIRSAINSNWGLQNARRQNPSSLTIRITSNGDTAFYFGFAPSKLTWLKETLRGKSVSVPVGSFWQVNPAVAEALFSHIRGWVAELNKEVLIDAFAGVGTFTLVLGDLFRHRVIIESDKQAVEAAKFNLAQAEMKATFIAKTTESSIGRVLSSVKASDTLVVIDPPRTGCAPETIKLLRKFAPSHILYVSCNPSTLARDLNLLCQEKYTPKRAAAFDMFPATAHFESALLLEKK